jgi:hypothetical protein
MSFLSASWHRPEERPNGAGERSSPHPGDFARERRHARDHLIPASPAHHAGQEYHCVATPPRWYTIRIRGRLGATALSAFPSMDCELKRGETVLTGRLQDRAALFGIIAQIEALGLELIELRRLEPRSPATDRDL